MRKIVSTFAAVVVIVAGGVLTPGRGFADGTVLAWSSRASMSAARYSAAAASTLDGDIVVFGGLAHPGADVIGDVERFQPASNSWMARTPMPTPRHNAGAATTADGTILVVGGFPAGGDATNVVEAYNPDTDSWSTRASLPTNAAGAAVVRGPDGTVFAIGGYPGCCFSYLNSVYAYNQATDSWTARAPMPTRRQSPGAALGADGKIYVVGGNGSGPVSQVVEVYDPATNSWQSRAPMPIAGNPSLVAAPDGKLYAFGYDDLGTVLQYDTAADTWTAVEPMPTPRQGTAAVLAGDGSIYTAGGYLPTANQTTAITERANFGGQPIVPAYNVATNTKSISGNNSITATASVAVPAGDTITVAVATGTFAGAVTCADSRGNSYKVAADKNTGAGRLFVCSAPATTALAIGDTVTATYPGFSGLSVITVNAISSAVVTGTVDRTSVGSGNNPNPTSGTVTTLQPNELIFGVVSHNSTPTLTPAVGYSTVGVISGGTGSGKKTITPEYLTVTTAGTYAATGTLSSAQQWRAAVITYQ